MRKRGLLIVVALLIILIAHAVVDDIKSGEKMRRIAAPNEYTGKIHDHERWRVEQIIRDYKRRRRVNTSLTKKVVKSAILGSVRGCLYGIAISSNITAIPGTMASFGALSGIMTWGGEKLPQMKYIYSANRPL